MISHFGEHVSAAARMVSHFPLDVGVRTLEAFQPFMVSVGRSHQLREELYQQLLDTLVIRREANRADHFEHGRCVDPNLDVNHCDVECVATLSGLSVLATSSARCWKMVGRAHIPTFGALAVGFEQVKENAQDSNSDD